MAMKARAILVGGALVLLACEVDSTDRGGEFSFDDGCLQFASCGTCTPISGCGWCFDSDGTGMCASGPGACATSASRWTWDPSGCRVAAEAGTGPAPDAGLPVEVTSPPQGCGPLGGVVATVPFDGSAAVEASITSDDASAAADTSAPDAMSAPADASPAAAPGCSIENPSSLCNVFQYELHCAGAAPVDSTCRLAPVPTPPGEEIYCCACFIESP
jgi:hypothetical protein